MRCLRQGGGESKQNLQQSIMGDRQVNAVILPPFSSCSGFPRYLFTKKNFLHSQIELFFYLTPRPQTQESLGVCFKFVDAIDKKELKTDTRYLVSLLVGESAFGRRCWPNNV